MAVMSAVVTSFMLLVNGSIIWAILSLFASQGYQWAAKPELSQFALFLFPVLLTLVEWKLLDYLRGQIRSQSES